MTTVSKNIRQKYLSVVKTMENKTCYENESTDSRFKNKTGCRTADLEKERIANHKDFLRLLEKKCLKKPAAILSKNRMKFFFLIYNG